MQRAHAAHCMIPGLTLEEMGKQLTGMTLSAETIGPYHLPAQYLVGLGAAIRKI
jgi:hypothetical protein